MAEIDAVTKPNMFAISSRDLCVSERKRTWALLNDNLKKILALYACGLERKSTGSSVNDDDDEHGVLPPALEVSALDELSVSVMKSTVSSDEHDFLPPGVEVSVLDGSAFVAALFQGHIHVFSAASLLLPSQGKKPSKTTYPCDLIDVNANHIVLIESDRKLPASGSRKVGLKCITLPLINLNVRDAFTIERRRSDLYSMLRNKLHQLLVLDQSFALDRDTTSSNIFDKRSEPFILDTTSSTVQETQKPMFLRQTAQQQDLDLAASSQLCQKQQHLVSLVIAIHNNLDAHLRKLIDNSAGKSYVSQESAARYKRLLNDIHHAFRFQRYTTQHLSHFFSVDTAASSETKDCSVDKDPNSYLGIRKLLEKYQNLLNLNQDLLQRLVTLQEHFNTPQSNGTNLISRTLNSTSAISRYHELVNDLETSLKCAEAAAWRFLAFPTSEMLIGGSGVVESESPPPHKKPVSRGGAFVNGFTTYCSSVNAFSKLSLDSPIGWGRTTT